MERTTSPIEITPEMLAAGEDAALLSYDSLAASIAESVFRAMMATPSAQLLYCRRDRTET